MSELPPTQAITNDGYGLGSSTSLRIPRGTQGLLAMTVDMSEIYRIVSRTAEIQRVTPATFGELITDFNLGMIQLNRIIGMVEIELKEAQNSLDTAEAIALLERVEDYLKARNVKSSADTREAAKRLDIDVISSTRTVDALTAISHYLTGLKNSLERAYFSAKQVTEFTSKDPYLNKTSGENKNGY